MALENERELDMLYRATKTKLPPYGPVPNYKVMKQLALQVQLSWLYPCFIAIAPLAILLMIPFQWLLLLIGATAYRRKAVMERACRVLSTTVENREIINAAIDSDPRIANLARYIISLNLISLGAELGLSRCASVIRGHLALLCDVISHPAVMRRDLLLHSRDALALLGLIKLAAQPEYVFVTDCHYQRWSFVLSHTAQDLRIVQHGFLDEELLLPNAGGNVSTLYLYDALFRASFERYYAINEHRLFSRKVLFARTPLSSDALFLASSFPSIDEEINLLESLKKSYCDVPIIVKFHPAHRYDARREKLAAYANLVYDGSCYPACRIFVSHASFMEFEYRRHGFATVSIARCKSVAAAVDEIHFLLANSPPSQSECVQVT